MGAAAHLAPGRMRTVIEGRLCSYTLHISQPNLCVRGVCVCVCVGCVCVCVGVCVCVCVCVCVRGVCVKGGGVH